MSRRSLYQCSHARVSGDRIRCHKGYPLSTNAEDGGIGVRRLAGGHRLAFGICQSCPDFDCMGPPIPSEDRGWLSNVGQF
ncbi:MAG: hypothetical protein H8D49_03680 [Dehalococcoidia bacterium]|nr:hypothetical protein [Dehalococcoidia bacterium]